MSTKMVTLKEKTSEVIADKVFGKAIEDYGEKSKRNVLVVTEFENRAEVIVSTNIARKLEKRPELVKALQELFESGNDGQEEDDYSLVSNRSIHFPKLASGREEVGRYTKNKSKMFPPLVYNIFAVTETNLNNYNNNSYVFV